MVVAVSRDEGRRSEEGLVWSCVSRGVGMGGTGEGGSWVLLQKEMVKTSHTEATVWRCILKKNRRKVFRILSLKL